MSDLRTSVPTVRAALHEPRPLLGAWIVLGDPIAAEAIGTVGFDWAGIDMQHGLIDDRQLVAVLQALAICGTPAIVRVSANDAAEIGHVLDAGAQGVIVPMVGNAADTVAAVAACRYAPAGRRSWGATRPALHRTPYRPHDGDCAAACIALVETLEGAERADEIAAVEGLDAIFFGPNDMALSAGEPPDFSFLPGTPQRSRLDRILAACREHEIAIGTRVPAGYPVPEYLDLGFRLLGVSHDLQDLVAGARTALAAGRDAVANGGHESPSLP